MKTHSGIAYLIENEDRNVMPQDPALAWAGTAIDPNRLFSRAGAEKSLRNLNPQILPDRLEAVLAFLDQSRERLVRHLEPEHGDLLFALHNNRDYSVRDEVEQSDDVSLRQLDRPREFFLCTDPRDFTVLRGSPYNVVLQNRKPAADDGSLSRLAARRGFRYVNLECEIGAAEAQRERVQWLEAHLPHRV